jgi:uncharacterized caspase-like protein
MRSISTLRLVLALLLLSAAFPPTGAAAERRIALIVGNGAYQNVAPLRNPPNDAQLMADTLKSAGFELVAGKALINIDKAALERAIRAFGQALRGGAVGLFYYSGHGVQIAGANYLVPVGANVVEELDAKFELVDAGLVLDAMANARNRLNIMILDACRNNPFGGGRFRAIAAGLSQVTAPAGTVISYATQPGDVAQDGTGSHSPYTEALATAIRQPGRDLFATFNEVGLRVKEVTQGEQQPWLATSPIEGQFFFAPGETDDMRRARLETEQLKSQADQARAEVAAARAQAQADAAARAQLEAQAKTQAAELAKAQAEAAEAKLAAAIAARKQADAEAVAAQMRANAATAERAQAAAAEAQRAKAYAEAKAREQAATAESTTNAVLARHEAEVSATTAQHEAEAARAQADADIQAWAAELRDDSAARKRATVAMAVPWMARHGNWIAEGGYASDSSCGPFRLRAAARGNAVSGTVGFSDGGRVGPGETHSFAATISDADTFDVSTSGIKLSGEFSGETLFVTITAPCGKRTAVARRDYN